MDDLDVAHVKASLPASLPLAQEYAQGWDQSNGDAAKPWTKHKGRTATSAEEVYYAYLSLYKQSI